MLKIAQSVEISLRRSNLASSQSIVLTSMLRHCFITNLLAWNSIPFLRSPRDSRTWEVKPVFAAMHAWESYHRESSVSHRWLFEMFQTFLESSLSLAQDAGQVEPIRVLLPGNFRQYHLIVVVPEGSTHLVVVHLRPLLPPPPLPGHLFRIQHPEFAIRDLPADASFSRNRIGQEFQQKLPQLNMRRTYRI